MKRRPSVSKEVWKLFLAKAKRRQELARLPFEKKILILIRLQNMAKDFDLRRQRTKLPLWNIP